MRQHQPHQGSAEFRYAAAAAAAAAHVNVSLISDN